MPNLPPLTIPQDALEKSAEKAKGSDYYAELTDDERAEEDLPPREQPAPAETKKPESKAEAEEPEDDKKTPSEEEPDESDDRLLNEILELRDKIDASLKPEPAPKEEPAAKDSLLEAALEHEDDVVRGLAERLQKAEQRLEARENEAREQRIAAQIAKDDAEFDAVQAAYLVGGKPMTDKHVEQIENFILKNPDAGRALSIEQLARAVFPDATRRAKSPLAKGPGDSPNGHGPAVATIVDQGTSGGASSGEFKPRTNETIESAIQEAGKRFGWKR